jgi:dienelactone hydrolase
MATIHVPVGLHRLPGELTLPPQARGMVLFAHASGSSRFSVRNQFVARALEQRGLGTLLIDLLTPDEEEVDRHTAHLRFDIALLAERLVAITEWLKRHSATASLPIGLFGASTGGGAALMTAAARPDLIAAVVSRGGRPDLAGPALAHVTAPTLLIVGGDDTPVIAMNRDAMKRMRGQVSIQIVPGATHLFEEPGALERVEALAGDWFSHHLRIAVATTGRP